MENRKPLNDTELENVTGGINEISYNNTNSGFNNMTIGDISGQLNSKTSQPNQVGGICGENDKGIIENCSNYNMNGGNSSGNQTNVGGICGENNNEKTIVTGSNYSKI